MTDDSDVPHGAGGPSEVEGRPTRREPTVEAEDSRVGSVLDDRYEIQKRIGSGGMGVVYQGMHLRLERTVVIKVLTEEKLRDETSLQRFEREAKSLSRLDHVNIVTVYDFGREGQLPYLVMEFVDGVEVHALLAQRGPLELELFKVIAEQILEGVAHAHKKGLVHRDLKPSNIMLTTRDENPYFVKLLDFGLAKLASGGKDVTANDNIVGSMPYLAPEQITGSDVDPRADVYSLGIVFYCMLTGRKPFRGSRASIVYDQVHSEPPPLRLQIPSKHRIPNEVVALIEECLSKDPEDRPVSAVELRERLDRSTEELDTDEIITDELGPREPTGGGLRRTTPGTSDVRPGERGSEASRPAGGPGQTDSAEFVDNHRTDDGSPRLEPKGETDMTLQEALDAPESASATETRQKESGGSSPWVAIVGGIALAVVGVAVGAWVVATMEPFGGDDNGTVAAGVDAAPPSFQEGLEAVDGAIASGAFSSAADRIDILQSKVDSERRRRLLNKREQRLQVHRLYEEAERARRSGEIASAISAYEDLLDIDPDFRDATAKLAELESYGRLDIDLEEEGATVEVDGEVVGEPPLVHPVAPGSHEVEVAAQDGEAWTKTVDVETNDTVQLAPVLEGERTAGRSGESDESEPPSTGEKSGSGAQGAAASDGENEQKAQREAQAKGPGDGNEPTGSAGPAVGRGDDGTELLDPDDGPDQTATGDDSTSSSGSGEETETELLPVQ